MEQARIAYNRVAPEGIRAMLGLERYVKQSGLDPGLMDLIRTRVSEYRGGTEPIDLHGVHGARESRHIPLVTFHQGCRVDTLR